MADAGDDAALQRRPHRPDESGEHRADDERRPRVARDVDADRSGALRVLPDRHTDPPERRPDDPPEGVHRDGEEEQNHEVEREVIVDVHEREREPEEVHVAHRLEGDSKSVVPVRGEQFPGRPVKADEAGELSRDVLEEHNVHRHAERQRDHREVYLLQPDAEVADGNRQQRGERHPQQDGERERR